MISWMVRDLKEDALKRTVLSAMFLSLGIVLPLITSQIKEIGDSFLPMHLVVLFCGILCGAKNGLIVGFILPFLRSLIFSMPPIYPNAVWMAFELATYGFVVGILHKKMGKGKLKNIYFSLICSMILGRIVWALAKMILLGLAGKVFTFEAFIVGGFIDALPGIILQLVLIPAVVGIIDRSNNR